MPRGGSEPIIKGIDFALEPGEALGIVGPSAAGKSTLCRLLMGVWRPTRGHIRLDGADLANWAPDELGQYVGYLPQDVELFAATVGDNIARLAPEPDPAKIIEAAQLAGVHQMVLQLRDGYDMEIGAEGHLLSGGQRQRIGLARALYGRPRLIVLDEPGANLDSEGEQALLTAIDAAKRWGATVVLVTHQPGALRSMDKMMLLVEGQIRFFGPRDQFLGALKPVAPGAQPAPVAPIRPGVRAPINLRDRR
jgi:ABC-type protease/lipase transport system fused ATPase/permease subunit